MGIGKWTRGAATTTCTTDTANNIGTIIKTGIPRNAIAAMVAVAASGLLSEGVCFCSCVSHFFGVIAASYGRCSCPASEENVSNIFYRSVSLHCGGSRT
jgi:hypothetical protein